MSWHLFCQRCPGTCQLVNSGLTQFSISSLTASPNGHIFAGMRNGGIFRSVRSTTLIEDREGVLLSSSFSLGQNYPNPFNPVTTFNFYIPERMYTTLTVHNTLGQIVAVLLNGSVEAGHHTVKWNPNAIPSGIYFYELKAGSYRKALKMTVLK